MTLYEACGKNVMVQFKDGSTMSGRAKHYMSALNNPEGKASLAIGYYEFFEDEVESIEEIKEPEKFQ